VEHLGAWWRTHYLPALEVGNIDEAVLGQVCGDLWGAIESLRGPLSLVQKALGGRVFSPELYGAPNEVRPDGSVLGTLDLEAVQPELAAWLSVPADHGSPSGATTASQ
jgi:hypothetical protein